MKKKILSTIFTMMLFAVLFTTATVEAKASAGGGLTVSGLKKDGTTEQIGDYDSSEDGWNEAMDLADDSSYLKKNGYEYIVVDLKGDWKAVDGQFTEDFFNGAGFDWDAIYIPEKARVILNMNGYTIDRGLTEIEMNGEVICIDEGANVIINGDNGTITGGASRNGAGGIHIRENAVVTLNDVCISGNLSHSKGSAVAVLENASLTMNGGQISKNSLFDETSFIINDLNCGWGTIDVVSATVTFNSVEIFGQKSIQGFEKAMILNADEGSEIVMENCKIYNNTIEHADGRMSLMVIEGCSSLTMNDCQVYQNGYSKSKVYGGTLLTVYRDSEIAITNSEFFENNLQDVLKAYPVKKFTITDSNFYDNSGRALWCVGLDDRVGTVSNCTFNNNAKKIEISALRIDRESNLTFDSCDLGDSTFENKQYATFTNCTGDGIGSLFGAGSAPMLIAMGALIAVFAGASVVVVKKRRAAEAK